ncbi:MAG: hypothetical protein ACLR3C_04405 [Eggerthella lenta]
MQANRLLDLFCELVRIESPSFHEAAMAARCADGCAPSASRCASTTGRPRGLRHRQPRRASSGTRAGHVVFSAHMDTVQPCAGIEPVVVDGIALGGRHHPVGRRQGRRGGHPRSVRSVLEADAPRPDVTVLFTTCEEQHLLGSSALADGLLPAGAPCYVLDADGAPGTVITGAPCH